MVLANSNPATIMTDPESADRTYIEPLTLEYLEEIIRIEREMSPGAGFAVLPTVGGQTALNLAIELSDGGVLEKYNAILIGANVAAIKKAEDRLFFKDAMQRIGLDVPKSALVNNTKDGLEFAGKIGFPVIIRPSFTLGGSGGGIAYNREEMVEVLSRGLDFSPVHEALIEESVLGWKEFELEVMRDTKDNVIIICSIENFDPMGVHTGDSITVAPDADPHRPRVPGDARRLDRGDPRDRRRHRRIEYSVRRESRDRADGRDRDEPARLAVFRAGLEGYGISNCEDCRETCRGLHARRNSQRHHAQDSGMLRADARLRRREDSEVAVREISRRRRHARPADEVGRRSDGHRPHLQRSADEGHPLARYRQARGRRKDRAEDSDQAPGHARIPSGSPTCSTRCARDTRSSRSRR